MAPFSASSRMGPASVEDKLVSKPAQLNYTTIQDMFSSYLHMASRGTQYGGFGAFFQRNTGIVNNKLNNMTDGEALDYVLQHYASNLRGY